MFEDHNHKGQLGPPYEAKKPITCPDCVKEMLLYRAGLCEKYGWKYWPWGKDGLEY